MMQIRLKKLFFFDAPGKGAFFALILLLCGGYILISLQWLLVDSMLCGACGYPAEPPPWLVAGFFLLPMIGIVIAGYYLILTFQVYYRHLSWWVIGGCAALIVPVVFAAWYWEWMRDASYMISTPTRRGLWLDGQCVFLGILAWWLGVGVLLPLAAARKTWLAMAATCSGAAGWFFGILALGMFLNPFKYFSLSAGSDLGSPVWDIAYGLPISITLALLAIAVTTALRASLWAELDGVAVRTFFSKPVIALCLAAVAAWAGQCLFSIVLDRRVLEVRQGLERSLGMGLDDTSFAAAFYRGRQPAPERFTRLAELNWNCDLPYHYSSAYEGASMALWCMEDPAAVKAVRERLRQHRVMVEEIDRFCADMPLMPELQNFFRNRAKTGCRSDRLIPLIQSLRIALAIHDKNLPEMMRVWRLYRHWLEQRIDDDTLSSPSKAAQDLEDFQGQCMAVINSGLAKEAELDEIARFCETMAARRDELRKAVRQGCARLDNGDIEYILFEDFDEMKFRASEIRWLVPQLWIICRLYQKMILTAYSETKIPDHPELSWTRDAKTWDGAMRRLDALREAVEVQKFFVRNGRYPDPDAIVEKQLPRCMLQAPTQGNYGVSIPGREEVWKRMVVTVGNAPHQWQLIVQ